MAHYFDEQTIPYYLCDNTGEMTLWNLLRIFTQSAISESEQKRYNREEEIFGWYIHSWDLKILRYPRYGEKVRSVTFPYRMERLFAKRNFLLLDEKGEILSVADTYWIAISKESLSPMRISEKDLLISEDAKPYLDSPRPKLRERKSYDRTENFIPSRHDIDSNNHVNNAVPIRWLSEMLWGEDKIRELVLVYRKELLLGETYTLDTDGEGFRITGPSGVHILGTYHRDLRKGIG